MHGVKRVRDQQSADAKAQRKEKEAKKLGIYLAAEKKFFDRQQADDLSIEALESTTEILGINPELYTAWNFRRRILSHLAQQHENGDPSLATQTQVKPDIFASLRIDAEEQKAQDPSSQEDTASQYKVQLLQEDLEMTAQALQMHPKVYWIWNHRKWCLQELPSTDADGLAKWKQELTLVERMLDYDARNFHGWDYRRFVLSELACPSTLTDDEDVRSLPFPQSLASEKVTGALQEHQLKLADKEVAYTLRKIEANFSNFSAWHQRSLLLPAIWSGRGLSEPQRRLKRDDEFELVRQALFVDPDDESVWTYHNWLVGLDTAEDVLEREIASIRELLDLEPDSRWCMQTLSRYLLLRRGGDDVDEAHQFLKRLQEIDPYRRQRYADMMDDLQGK